MSLVDALRGALGARTAVPSSDETSLEDDSPDTQKECNKTEEILQILNEIKAQLEIQNQELAFLRSKSADQQTPELLPRPEDWSDEVLIVWRQSRYPTQAKLSQGQKLFKNELQAYKSLIYISVPGAAVPSKKVVTARAAPDINFLDSPTLRERGLLDSTSIPLLLSAWPSSLMSGLDDSRTNNGDDSQRWLEFQWALPQAKDQKFEIEMCEISYDSRGYPQYGKRYRRMINGILDDRNSESYSNAAVLDHSPWSGKVCGHVVQISMQSTRVMSMKAIAFALWHLQHLGISRKLSSAETEAVRFIMSFASPWGIIPQIYSVLSRETVFLRFQVRWMAIATTRPQAGAETYHGIWLHRDEGDVPNRRRSTHDANGSDDNDLYLHEMRCGFAIHSTMVSRLPLYTMVVLWDKDQRLQTSVDLDMLITGNAIPETYRIGYLSGVGFFLSEISRSLKLVRHDLMFDDAKFSKSDEYFAVLQILHTCTEWIKGVSSDLEGMHVTLNHMILTEIAFLERFGTPEEEEMQQELTKAQPHLDSVFAYVIAEHEKQTESILSRIERKMEEIKGLRDGLFNATSVREAAKGTSLAESSSLQNRYILVFTIATILYLPMGFVTSWYGMNWFTPDTVHSATKIPFIIVFVVVSVVTYVVAACGLWYVHDWQS
ncbi:hypothetical protein FOQG_17271 [Fusarium oxysporum f. sp. raphani 54005]|uniref:Uncharacterized protein n=1 Tax=Fusarium oxysporum f. sp. raphani 54005 TaxID=1089458 RepID=X0B8E0_FUSOX|nr:hypothetical protein FOQG_17271 [Fusarium oxysporum f. sp. raphani 54005]